MISATVDLFQARRFGTDPRCEKILISFVTSPQTWRSYRLAHSKATSIRFWKTPNSMSAEVALKGMHCDKNE